MWWRRSAGPPQRWPRFLSQDLHRNLSLLCLAFLGVHVATTVLDGYVPIGLLDVFVPFRSPYRPLYVGLGALGLDLLLAVLVTSALRHRIGYGSWRFVHWLAYLCWPIAVIHGLGSGTDSQLPVVLVVEAVCTAAVLGAFAWRMTTGRSLPSGGRAAAGVGALVATLVIAGFAALGPLRPGWSHRSGTSSALLAQLAAKNGTAATVPTAPSGRTVGTSPSVPFTSQVTGTSDPATSPDAQGNVQVTLAMHLAGRGGHPPDRGPPRCPVRAAACPSPRAPSPSGRPPVRSPGSTGARSSAPSPPRRPMTLTITLQVDQQTGGLSGTVSGTAGTDR